MEMGEVIDAIDTMGKDQLNEIAQAIQDRRGVLSQRAARQFQKGDEVQFEHKGRTIVGIVEKINIKTVSLHEKDNEFTCWRVGPNYLTKVSP